MKKGCNFVMKALNDIANLSFQVNQNLILRGRLFIVTNPWQWHKAAILIYQTVSQCDMLSPVILV